MSNLDLRPDVSACGGLGDVAPRPVLQVHAGKQVMLGESTAVRRLLPNLGRRLIGAWCFVDHYGPDDIASGPGMQVPPHPHIGLQTVSWLLEGQIHHRDSLGNDALLRPGQLGLMTAGNAIAHAEQSPQVHPAALHGVQLWVALPEASRHGTAGWEHHATLPRVSDGGVEATVILGELSGASSPGTTHTPLLGAELALSAGSRTTFALDPDFEHGLLVMSGTAQVQDAALTVGSMAYLGCARRELTISSTDGARVMLLGGVPLEEKLVMWWNFVGRSHEEVAAARAQWNERDVRFADVPGFDGFRLTAPDLPGGRLRPGGATR